VRATVTPNGGRDSQLLIGVKNCNERQNCQQHLRRDDLRRSFHRTQLHVLTDGLVILPLPGTLFAMRAPILRLGLVALRPVRPVAVRGLRRHRLPAAQTIIGDFATKRLRHEQCENAQCDDEDLTSGSQFQSVLRCSSARFCSSNVLSTSGAGGTRQTKSERLTRRRCRRIRRSSSRRRRASAA
jgi:hypothetical protein